MSQHDTPQTTPTTPETVGNAWGFLCPQCHSGESLGVDIVVTATLYPDGTDVQAQDHEWGADSNASCFSCLWTGKVQDFTIAPGFES